VFVLYRNKNGNLKSECTEKYNSNHRKLASTIANPFIYCALILVVFWLTEGDIMAVFFHWTAMCLTFIVK
jgi:hypothetical protein